MKKLILSLFMIISFVFAGAQSIEFESKVVDYGMIEHNADGNREFTFINNGDQPLIINVSVPSFINLNSLFPSELCLIIP